MAKKIFLIAVFIISLLLIGLMLLVADVRNNNILNDFNTIEENLEKENTVQKDIEPTPKKYPVSVQQFKQVSDALLQNIKTLKKDFKVGDSFEEMDARKNHILFETDSNTYSDKGTEFMANIEAYENIVARIHKEYSNVGVKIIKIRTVKAEEDWLVENFKNFPVISVNGQLRLLESGIIKQQKDIFIKVLPNQ